MHLKISSGKWRPFCLSPNVLTVIHIILEWLQKQFGTTTYILSFLTWHDKLMDYNEVTIHTHRLHVSLALSQSITKCNTWPDTWDAGIWKWYLACLISISITSIFTAICIRIYLWDRSTLTGNPNSLSYRHGFTMRYGHTMKCLWNNKWCSTSHFVNVSAWYIPVSHIETSHVKFTPYTLINKSLEGIKQYNLNRLLCAIYSAVPL